MTLPLATPSQTAIPVTIIGGFLGAGKTTLVNRILRSSSQRLAVLVNDFGDINVDASLITAEDDLTIELSGGCMCCSMAEGVGPALTAAKTRKPTAILIEASGVAEPRRIAEFAILDRHLKLDMIVLMANAALLAKHLNDPLVGDVVARQFSGIDLVVLNHVDHASKHQITASHKALQTHAGGKQVVETRHADLPLDLLTGGALSLFQNPGTDLPNSHDHVFHRDSYVSDSPISRPKLEAALESMPSALLRMKGTLLLEDGLYQINVVGHRTDLTLVRQKTEQIQTTLVSIGTDPNFRISHFLSGCGNPTK